MAYRQSSTIHDAFLTSTTVTKSSSSLHQVTKQTKTTFDGTEIWNFLNWMFIPVSSRKVFHECMFWCCYVHSSVRPSVEQKMTRTIFMSWKILLFAISSILFLLYVKVKVIKPKMVRYMETTFSYFNTRETRIKKMLNNSMTLIMMIVEFNCYNNYRSYFYYLSIHLILFVKEHFI